MQIQHLAKDRIVIDETGVRQCQSFWRLMPDALIQTQQQKLLFRKTAEEWMGNIGDPWREADDENNYRELDNIRVLKIECREEEHHHLLVIFTGCEKANTSQLEKGSLQLHVNAYGEKVRQGVWILGEEDPALLHPAIGSILEWAGEEYCCENVDLIQIPSGWQMTVTARCCTLQLLQKPSYCCNSQMEQIMRATWQMAESNLSAFLAKNPVGSDAASWAGKDYVVTQVECKDAGGGRFCVTLSARHIGVRLLEVRRLEKLSGSDLFGRVKRTITYIGRWRVREDAKSSFENITAFAPAGWADASAVVTAVSPRYLGGAEWEYTIEAQHRNNPLRIIAGPGGRSGTEQLDDRSDLSGRVDVRICGVREFRMSAQECGYFRRSSGLVLINQLNPGGWIFDLNSPFLRLDGIRSEWPLTQIDRPIGCIELEVVRFQPGGPAINVADAIRYYGENLILNGTLANFYGSWRIRDRQVDGITDSTGDIWSKLTERWLLAPDGLLWNAQYWRS